MRDEPCERPAEPAWLPSPVRIAAPPMQRYNLRWSATEANQAREWEAHCTRMLSDRGSWWTVMDIANRSQKTANECWCFAAMYLLHALSEAP